VAADAPALAPAPPAPPAAPAALPGVNAVLTMWGAGGWLYSEDYDFANCCDYGRSYFAGGAEAAFTGRNWQFDFVAATHGDTSSSDDDNPTYFGLGGHFLMPSDGRVLGGFAAVTATSMHDTDDWALHLIGGVEAAMTMGNTRMFAQLGALVAIAGDTTETWERGIFGVVGVQHFLSASTMASADVMLGHGRFDESTTSGWTAAWTVALEHRLSLGSGLIDPEDEDCGECYCREEGVCAPVVSGVDSAPVLEAREHVLDLVAFSVEDRIVGVLDAMLGMGRDAGSDAPSGERLAEGG
jgi:hypothetical protein